MGSLIKELPILLYDYLVISGLVTTINDSLSLALSGSIAYKITISTRLGTTYVYSPLTVVSGSIRKAKTIKNIPMKAIPIEYNALIGCQNIQIPVNNRPIIERAEPT